MAIRLLVEGKLDEEILTAVLGNCEHLEGGSKNALFPKTKDAYQAGQTNTRYVRDRDFDFDPPEDLLQPTPDRSYGKTLLGWRWARHEMENYLLDPVIFAGAFPGLSDDYPQALTAAAHSIVAYNAARWAIGKARRSLPPNYDLETRPDLKEYSLPNDCGLEPQRTWAVGNAVAFGHRIAGQLEAPAILASFNFYLRSLEEAIQQGPDSILVWFAGKDLCAALVPWLSSHHPRIESGRLICHALRDWIRSHPESALQAVPEWKAMESLTAKHP